MFQIVGFQLKISNTHFVNIIIRILTYTIYPYISDMLAKFMGTKMMYVVIVINSWSEGERLEMGVWVWG